VKWEYAPVGLSDLVIFFLRRIYDLLRPGGFTALITTNSIKDGDNRRDGLDWLVAKGGVINMAVRGMKWPGQAKVVVSLLTIHRGPWSGKHSLDGKEAPTINSFFEDSPNVGEPVKLVENEDKIFQGVIFLGDGFLLTTDEAERMCRNNPRCGEVVFSVINGQELNNQPDQSSERKIINFFDWSLTKASDFGEAFERIRDVVKPVREKDNRALYRERWWQYGEPRRKLTANLLKLKHCFGTSRVTKYLNFSACSADLVFSNNVYVFTTERWDQYAVVQSTLHEVWARKYSMSLKQDLQYSPTDCFHTFSFPSDPAHETALAASGKIYHEHRRALMRDLWLGLTDLYNLFHDPDLTPELVTESLGDRATITGDEGFTRLLRLRDLHRELDQTVLTGYGWHIASDFGPPLALGHNFHAVEFLPENDRTRYTIHPEARRELLTRLLKLNHERAAQAQQVAKQEAIAAPKKKSKPKQPVAAAPPELNLPLDLFGRPATAQPQKAPEFASFSAAYPSGAVDKLICALALDIVAWREKIPSSDHLDALILATHPDLCRVLMTNGNTSQLDIWTASIKNELKAIQTQGLKWVACLDYLKAHRNALKIGTNESARPIDRGVGFESARQAFPCPQTAIAAFALSILDSLKTRRQAEALSTEQKIAVTTFEQLHSKYALA
jgi:hypothetical protein